MGELLRERPVGPAISVAPAGWYPDVERPGSLRYWDGQAWTEHRANPRWHRASSGARWLMVAISAAGIGLVIWGATLLPETPTSSGPDYYCSEQYIEDSSIPVSVWLVWLALCVVGAAAVLVRRMYGHDDRLMTWLARLGILSVVFLCPVVAELGVAMDCGL